MLEPEQDKVKTSQAIWLNTIAAKAQGKVKAERALALAAELEQDRVRTSPGRWLNKIIGRAREQVMVEQDKAETSIRQEIKATGGTWGETKPRCTPATWAEPEVLLANRT